MKRARGDRTQEEIALAAGVDRSQINAWEKGRRGMGEENAVKVARALGADLEELLSIAEEPGVVAELAHQLALLELRVRRLEGQSG